MGALAKPGGPDRALAASVELLEAVFRIAAEDDGRDQFTPFGVATRFVRAHRDRLTASQKRTLFALVTATGDGPYPGPPLDLLSELAIDPALAPDVVEKLRFWVSAGLFDRVDPSRRSDSPRIFWGMVDHLKDPAHKRSLLDEAGHRIRKLLRSNDDERVVAALRWIADADRLSAADRHVVQSAVEEGLYSSEFEGWPHASTVAPLVRLLLESVTRVARNVGEAKVHVRSALKAVGLPDHVP